MFYYVSAIYIYSIAEVHTFGRREYDSLNAKKGLTKLLTNLGHMKRMIFKQEGKEGFKFFERVT